MTVSEERFFEAKSRVLSDSSESSGIGTLAEKSLHKILKLYIEPRGACHEIPVLGSVADIKNEEGITEIQTKSFDKLLPKLRRFLTEYPVTVVHPIITEKHIVWIDPETGEVTEPKKSPKRGRPTDVLPELYRIAEHFGDGRLTVRLILLTATEYKYLDGYGKDRKKRATRIDRLPTAIANIIELRTVRDVAALLPPTLTGDILAKQLDRVTALRGRNAYLALKCLVTLGIIEKKGKQGNAFVYKRII